jgi:hypothetical protein
LFIHPVHIILFLGLVTSVSLIWIFLSNRRVGPALNSGGEHPCEVDVLRERIAVLEKLAIDPASRLASEIEDLRRAR